MKSKWLTPDRYEKFMAVLLCTLPIMSSLIPRALAVVPAVIALLLCFAYRCAQNRWPALYRPAFIWAGLIFAVMVASGLWSIDAHVSLDRAVKTLPIMMFGALLFSIARDSDGRYFRLWFPFALIFSAMICAIQLYTHGIFYFMVHERVRFDTHVNLFYLNRSDGAVMLMVPVAVTCLRASIFPTRVRHMLFAALGALLLVMAALTNSQSALLAFLLGTMFYFLFPVTKPKAWAALGVLLAALIFASPWLAQWMFDVMPEYVKKVAYLKQAFALNRLEIWDYIARRALERPLLGHGIEATEVIKDFDSAQIYNQGTSILHPHNFALQLWIELGVVGAAFGTLFLAAILRGMSKLDVLSARAALAMFVMALSIVSTGYGMWQPMWVSAYGLMFALCALSVPSSEKSVK